MPESEILLGGRGKKIPGRTPRKSHHNGKLERKGGAPQVLRRRGGIAGPEDSSSRVGDKKKDCQTGELRNANRYIERGEKKNLEFDKKIPLYC